MNPDGPLSRRDALTIARIVKVNHAGEYGAIRIYAAQIAIAARRYPEIVAALDEMLAHEKEHCALFSDAMPARQTKPCRVMSLWAWGGSLLGALTAMMGQQALWVCTAAVEETVHRHLDEQLAFLKGRDAELYATIASIREEELAHLHLAQAKMTSPGWRDRTLQHAIAIITEMLIWLSTWGDSTRLKRELAADH